MNPYMKDVGKYPLVIAQIMLSYLCLWPLNTSFIIRVLRYFILVNAIIGGIFHIYYMLSKITDMEVMASSCTTVSTTIQTVVKICIISYYSNDLVYILQTISSEFWPANIVDSATEQSIRNGSRLIITFVCIYLSTAFYSCWNFMAANLISGRRILPMESSFPFEWEQSPRFEILYTWHFIMCQYTVIHTLAAHDFFFEGLVMNCVAQFKLLENALLTIGSGRDKILNKKLKRLPHFLNKGLEDDVEYELIAKCVRHHNLVLDICDRLQSIYGAMVLLQFFLSATALCVSSFVVMQYGTYLTKMVSFSIAHMVQFFFLCTVGNELISRSQTVADGAYASEWYKKPSVRVRQGLLLIIQRAQREQAITALGFANLDYPNFVNILRLSFSFYTLLSSIEVEL